MTVGISPAGAAAPAAGEQGTTQSAAAAGAGESPTAVAGPAWRKHLGLLYSESAMGRVGRYAPDESAITPTAPPPPRARRVDSGFQISGADIFRYNCQSCHTPGGTGEPPEINSMIGPVQSTSRAMIRKRLEARGLPVDAAQINELAAQGETAIRDRLLNGGQKMPAFPHLTPAEVNALLGYLHQLVGDPDAPKELPTMREPVERVGQHIVKGTCHICHDAQGPDTIGVEPLLPTSDTPIPSLQAISRHRTFDDLVRKVREGLSGHGAETVHGKMPLLSYLSEDEIAAAECFLLAYPPRP
ncbi:MAG: c-type cytochrome [Acidobacteriota bacterium]